MIFKKRISLKEPQFTGVGGYTYMKLRHYACLSNGLRQYLINWYFDNTFIKTSNKLENLN